MAKKPDDALLDVIRAQLGYTESPNGWTKFGAWWAKRHSKPTSWAREPWCDMFISWAAAQVGLSHVVGDAAWTVGHASWFKARGQWGHEPKKAAIVFFDWDGSKNIPAIDHVGIVEAVRDGGRTIVCLEGNTANQMLRRYRSPADIAGYGYPAYPGATPKPPTKPTPHWTEALVKKLPALRRNAKGWHVKTAYGLLYARGFPVAAGADDTTFGGPMEDALLAFQKAAGLKTDAVIGEKTWAALLRVA